MKKLGASRNITENMLDNSTAVKVERGAYNLKESLYRDCAKKAPDRSGVSLQGAEIFSQGVRVGDVEADMNSLRAGGAVGNHYPSVSSTNVRDQESVNSMPSEYERFTQALMGRYGKSVFEAYLSDITVAAATANLVTFETASPSRRDMIGRHYLNAIKQLWRDTVGPVDRVTIKLRPDVSRNLSENAERAQSKEVKNSFFKDISGQFTGSGSKVSSSQKSAYKSSTSNADQGQWISLKDLLSPVDERNSFDNFAVDASNSVAFAAAKSAVSGNGPAELIYLYGKSGVGKTHLLHAISLEGARINPEKPVAYLAYNNIASGCVSAMLSNNVTALHREFLNCSIVLIDDIHLLISKDKTQQQVLAIIDACLSSGVHVAVAGEPAPVKLAESGIYQRLADRLSGGFSVPLMQGGPHLRFEVLKKYLSRSESKCTVTAEVLEFIVRNFTHSMRETIGALKQLLLVYGDKEMRVDLSLAKSSLRTRLQDGKRVYSLDDLLSVTAEVMGVSVADLKGRARPQPIARARHAFVYCAREDLKESLPSISAAMGRDHTTALSSARRAAALLEKDKVFCRQVAQIREKIEL